MKNRLLPSGFLTALLGMTFLLFSAWTWAGEPGDPLKKSRVNQVTGKIDARDVIKAQQINQQNYTKATGGLGLDWQPMGPENYAGKTVTVMFDNRDNTYQTIYTGGTSGGIWRSNNLGLTWHEVNTNSGEVLRVASLAQTTNGVIYAATGVTACFEIYDFGSGLYRSTDGENFEVIASTALNADWAAVSRITVDARNNRLFAATIGGLFYSDNGDTWTKIKNGMATDVEVGSDGTLLAVVDKLVYRAPGGDLGNLQLVSADEEGKLPVSDVSWVQTAIAPSDVNVMYASVVRVDGNLKSIYRSGDKGNTWNVIFPYNTSFEPYYGEGCYANTLAVTPDNPDILLLGGYNMFLGQKHDDNGYYYWELVSFGFTSDPNSPVYVPSYHHDYVFRPGHPLELAIASNGGITIGTRNALNLTFQTSNRNLSISRMSAVTTSKSIHDAMGGGQGTGVLTLGYYFPSLVNTPGTGYQILFNGINGGSCAWSSINENMAVFSSNQLDPPVLRQELTDLTYTNDFMVDITNTYDEVIPMKMWESFEFTYSYDSVTFRNRTDTLIPAGTPITMESLNSKFPFIVTTPTDIPVGDSLIVADPIANRFFMSGTANTYHGVFMTKDALKMYKTPEWYMIFKIPGAAQGHVSAMAVSQDLNYMWLGTDSGYIFRVSNLTLAHDSATADLNSPTCIVSNELINIPAIKGRIVTSLSIDPTDPKKVLFTLGNFGNSDYVYYTMNAFDSLPEFTDITGNLPPAPVYTSLIEMDGGNKALIGTEYGVYTAISLNGNVVWAPDQFNMGNVPVTQLVQQTVEYYPVMNSGMIYAASYGSGFWMDSTYRVPVGIDPGTPVTGAAGQLIITPNPVKDKATITLNGNEKATSLLVYDLTGRPVMAGTLGNTNPETRSVTLDLSPLAPGTYVIRLGSTTGKFIKQ